MSGSADPSDPRQAVQWPSPQPWPDHPPLRLGVMASGDGSNFEAVVEACRQGRLRGHVVLLVINNADCGARRSTAQAWA